MEEAMQLGLDLYENKARAVVGESVSDSVVCVCVCVCVYTQLLHTQGSCR